MPCYVGLSVGMKGDISFYRLSNFFRRSLEGFKLLPGFLKRRHHPILRCSNERIDRRRKLGRGLVLS